MNEPAFVSVVMCTYNGAQFLDEQINSILQQDHPHFELVIVDDNSADETWQKLRTWQQQDSRIKIFKNEFNLGYNQNFEKAIGLATGEFISIADQDDIWMPAKLSKTLAAFKDPSVVLAHCKSVRLQDGQLKYHLAKLHYHFHGNDTRRLFFFNQVMGHDMVFRKELMPHIIPFPAGMSYDWWIAVVATCYGNIAAVDEYLVHHRIHSANNFFNKEATSKKRELDLLETLRLFRKIPALKESARKYLDQEIELLEQHEQKPGFDWKLFRFLYANRHIAFGHKRRSLQALSYLKNAIKYAKMGYRGKGISI